MTHIIGSGNLTVRGFSTNWEVFSEITFTADSGHAGVFAEAWRLIEESAKGATRAVRRQLEQMRKTSGSVLSTAGDEDWPRLLFATPNQPSLLKQLKSIVGNSSVRRVVIVSPFFDPRLQAVKEFDNEFGVKDIVAVVQQTTVSFPGNAAEAATALAVHDFVPPHGGKSGYLHAKAYIIQTATTEYCVWGSPNCSMAALGGQGNYEAVLVTRGKPGYGIAALGLEESVAKGQKINPSKLSLARDKLPRVAAALSVISAEVDHGEIVVAIAPRPQFAKCSEGRLRLWSKGELIGEVKLKRRDNTEFVGRLNRSKGGSSVICRLVLRNRSGEQESPPVAIHFLDDLEEATPTRFQARIHKVVDAIHSGTFDWAKGLESVCELVIKIGLHDDLQNHAGKGASKRGRKPMQPDNSEGEAKVGAYEDFLSDVEDTSTEAKETQARNFLEDVVAALRVQLLRGVTRESDDEDDGVDRDTWRYREEAERHAAESGVSEPQHDLPDAEVLEQEHSRIHRAYVRLMRGLTQRYEWLHGHRRPIAVEEFWRLDAVNLLLLHGCSRLLDQAHELGPVLSPEDIMNEYIPALAVFFGRVRLLRSPGKETGPLLDWVQTEEPNAAVTNTVKTTCALLAGLLAQWRQAVQPAFDDDSRAEWSQYTEIVVARCMAALFRRNMLPSTQDVSELVERSEWLTSIGCNRIVARFNDLCRLARSIVRSEDQFCDEQRPSASQNPMPGDWVCTAVSGVTVAVSVSNSTVEIAMIGHPDNEDWFREVDSAHVVRTNIPTKVRVRCDYVADELDYLLPYTDGDFEEWRDLIMPHLERGYVITLSKIAKGARSSLLRKEASKLLARNAAACKAPEK